MDQVKAKPQLDAMAFTLAEQVRNQHWAEIGEGVTRQDLLDPAFWAHISSKLHVYDEITVIRTDGTLHAKVLVLQTERTWARVFITDWHDLTTRDVSMSQPDPTVIESAIKTTTAQAGALPAAEPEVSGEFSLVYKGPRLKWCVKRATDGQHVREGEPTKASARTWLDEYVKVIS